MSSRVGIGGVATPGGLAVLVALAALAGPAPAGAGEEQGHASGSFASRGVSFAVNDAFAFEDVGFLGDGKVYVVAVSNQGFGADFIARYRDRRYLLDNFFKDEETGLVYFEFSLDGKYEGLSYYLESGNGCGYCSGGVDSTVKLAGGKLVGRLSMVDAESERSFAIELDVPVTSADFGAAQGAGGGAPGKAYLAFHEAVLAGDLAALERTLGDSWLANLTEAKQSGRTADYLAALRGGNHPERSLRVTDAFVQGDLALVQVVGDSSIGRVEGEAILSRVDGAWRIDDEYFQLKLE